MGRSGIEEEAYVRRLKWYQQVARTPSKHADLLAAMFGKYAFEDTPTVQQGGRIAEGANTWAKQFQKDIQGLHDSDDGQSLLEAIGENVMEVFRGERHKLVLMDMSLFRRATTTSRVPPPECLRVQNPMQPAPAQQCADTAEEEEENDANSNGQEEDMYDGGDEQQEQGEYRCQCQDMDGNQCGAVFSSRHALAVHVASSKAEGHGKGIWNVLAVTNQCPKCRVCFSGRRTAVQHIKKSIQRGHCTGKGSMVVYEPEPIECMACGFCDEKFLDLEGLYVHMCLHVPGWD